MKRLIFDIEVSPNIAWMWKPEHYTTVSYDNILIEGKIICICWKWAGQHIVHSLTWDKKHNEKKMLEVFIAEANKADEIITHNGEHFDIKWLRTRCSINGVSMMPDYVSLDTYKAAKHHFNFNSNKLAYIAKSFGLGEKMETGGSKLWKRVLMGQTEIDNPDFWSRPILGNNPSALAHMVAYCKQDVNLLEKVFDRMNTYMKPKTHYGRTTSSCPECGSENTVVNMRRITAAGITKVTMHCKNCGKYHSVPESKLTNPKPI